MIDWTTPLLSLGLLGVVFVPLERLFTRRDRARLKLIVRGKRFGFSLEEIRQVLDLYHLDDQQQSQISKAYEIAKERLADMESKREELDAAISDLKEQLEWGAEMIAQSQPKTAAAG